MMDQEYEDQATPVNVESAEPPTDSAGTPQVAPGSEVSKRDTTDSKPNASAPARESSDVSDPLLREFEDFAGTYVTYDDGIERAITFALTRDVPALTKERERALAIQEIAGCVLSRMEWVRETYNRPLSGVGQVPRSTSLPPRAVARIVAALHPVAVITPAPGSGGEGNYLVLYRTEGPRVGTYHGDDDGAITRLIRAYNPNFRPVDVADVMDRLSSEARQVQVTTSTDVIVVGNCVLRFTDGDMTSEPFTPEIIVQSKIVTNYNPDAVNPVIEMPDGQAWDFESWLLDVAGGDEARYQLLWWMIASVLRPRQGMDYLFLPFNTEGNNGKGTLLHLLRQVIGPGLCASVSLGELGTQFGAHGLLGTFANLVDENAVGSFTKDSTVVKAVVTHDPVSVNRKNKSSVSLTYMGTQVQCVNEIPRFMDKSDSLFRRLMPIPFPRSFKGVGIERKYIKSEYMARQDVCEYVLHRAMTMDLSDVPASILDSRIPSECRDLLNDVRSENDPLVEFFGEWEAGVLGYEDDIKESTGAGPFVMPKVAVYDAYVLWMKKNRPKAAVVKSQVFHTQFKRLLDGREWWSEARTKPDWMFIEFAGPWLTQLADFRTHPGETLWAMTYSDYRFTSVEANALVKPEQYGPSSNRQGTRRHNEVARHLAQQRTRLDALNRWRGYAFDPSRLPFERTSLYTVPERDDAQVSSDATHEPSNFTRTVDGYITLFTNLTSPEDGCYTSLAEGMERWRDGNYPSEAELGNADMHPSVVTTLPPLTPAIEHEVMAYFDLNAGSIQEKRYERYEQDVEIYMQPQPSLMGH